MLVTWRWACMGMGLLAVACADGGPKTPSDDDTDTDTVAADTDPVDTDGVLDDTDPRDLDTDGEPRTYDTVTPVIPFNTFAVDGITYVTAVPEPVRGLVFVFHGTGGDATLAENPEVMDILNEMIDVGIGFVALDSDNRATGVFDASTGPATNDDWVRVSGVRDSLIDDERITASTTIFTWGYSAGGAFASYVGHAGEDAGWPMGGMAFHQSIGASSRFGGPPALPAIFLPAQNDTTVDPAAVVQRHETHLSQGHASLLLWHRPRCLVPTRFARSPFLGIGKSETLYALAIDSGLVDAEGCPDYAPNEVAAAVNAFTDRPDVTPFRPVKAVLNVVFATHAVNGEHAARQASFFSQQL